MAADVAAWATVAAALLALLSIVLAAVSARRGRQAIVRERRIDFELTLLKELASYVSWPESQGDRAQQMLIRLGMLPADELPLCRARRADGQGDLWLREQLVQDEAHSYGSVDRTPMRLDGRTLREHMLDEVRDAVAKRLTMRD